MTLRRLCTFLLLMGALLPRGAAWASAFYYEFQGGLSSIRGANPFFASAAPSADRGFALNATLAYSFTGGEIPMEMQAGIQYRAVTGSREGMEYYGIQAPYVLGRLQMSRVYVGAGIAPYVWRRVNAVPGLDLFSRADSALGYLLEGGILWPVTPQFTLGGTGAGQFITTSGTLSPKPSLELTVLLRFYFGFSKTASGSSTKGISNEFRGWRYPFGREMR